MDNLPHIPTGEEILADCDAAKSVIGKQIWDGTRRWLLPKTCSQLVVYLEKTRAERELTHSEVDNLARFLSWDIIEPQLRYFLADWLVATCCEAYWHVVATADMQRLVEMMWDGELPDSKERYGAEQSDMQAMPGDQQGP